MRKKKELPSGLWTGEYTDNAEQTHTHTHTYAQTIHRRSTEKKSPPAYLWGIGSEVFPYLIRNIGRKLINHHAIKLKGRQWMPPVHTIIHTHTHKHTHAWISNKVESMGDSWICDHLWSSAIDLIFLCCLCDWGHIWLTSASWGTKWHCNACATQQAAQWINMIQLNVTLRIYHGF